MQICLELGIQSYGVESLSDSDDHFWEECCFYHFVNQLKDLYGFQNQNAIR